LAPLPIFYDDLKSSVKAAMIFPRDPQKAKAYVGWVHAQELGPSEVVRAEVAEDAAAFAPYYQEAIENLIRGYDAAFLVGVLWGLICSDPKASWEGAIKIREELASKIMREKLALKIAGSQSEFWDCLRAFGPVLHLQGARYLRFARFMRPDLANVAAFAPELVLVSDQHLFSSLADEAVGYLPAIDLLFFLHEAVSLRERLQAWNQRRPSPSTLLTEMFELDLDQELVRKLRRLRPAGWPSTGTLEPWKLYPQMIPTRRRPGRRPKKSP
jgi:hypothetical protein